MKACIIGTGRYLPDKIITNDMLAQMVDTSDEWIRTRTGIGARRATAEPTWVMAARAAESALESSGIPRADIDMVIGCTASGDYFFPSLACVVQGELGLKGAFCFDAIAGCTGFVYALDIAQAYVASGRVKNALIVCAEGLTRMMDFDDRSTCVLFGDGAGAAVVSAREDRGVLQSTLSADGSQGPALFARSVQTSTPFADIEDSFIPACPQGKVHMDGRAVYKYAVKFMESSVREVCARAGVAPGDIDVFIPHQANLRIIDSAASRLGMPMDRVVTNLERYANTSAASIPIAISEQADAGRLRDGDLVCIAAAGAGLTSGAALMRWQGR